MLHAWKYSTLVHFPVVSIPLEVGLEAEILTDSELVENNHTIVQYIIIYGVLFNVFNES